MKLEFINETRKALDGHSFRRRQYRIGSYAVYVTDAEWANCGGSGDIEVRACEGGNPYLPDIYYDRGWGAGAAPCLKIQTTSYGTLNEQEFRRFLEAQREALEVVQALTSEFEMGVKSR